MVDRRRLPAALAALVAVAALALTGCGRGHAVLTITDFRFPHPLLAYPDAGHFVSLAANVPYLPGPDGAPGAGSTAQANPLASADAWPRTVAFLQSS